MVNPIPLRACPRASRLVAVLAAATLLATLVACGDDRSPLDAVHLGGERFTDVTFEDLPRPSNGTQTAYLATGLNQQEELEIADTDAETVLAWYDERLQQQGWTKDTEAQQTREGTLVTYERMGRTLALLAANAEPTTPGERTPATVTVSFNRLARPGTKREAPRDVIQTTTTQS